MTRKLTLDDGAAYRIQVQGTLGPRWVDYLGGLDISITQRDPPVTTLSGRVKDQAALIGIINGLYDLEYPLLSLEHTST